MFFGRLQVLVDDIRGREWGKMYKHSQHSAEIRPASCAHCQPSTSYPDPQAQDILPQELLQP